MSAELSPPLWLLAELTHACPLQCPYCSNPLKLVPKQQELETESWLRVLHDARQLGAVQLGLSGGEPLVRTDLEELISAASKLGYYSNLITSGVGMDEDRVAAFREGGLDHIQISIQAGDQVLNDYIAGCDSFQKKIDMAKAVKRNGYPMVLCFVIHRENIDQVTDMLELAIELQADFVELATTQYEGWALLNRRQLLPDRQQLEQAEAVAHEYQEKLKGKMKIYYVVPDYYEGTPKACMDGWGKLFLTITPDGVALPCHAARDLPDLDFYRVSDRELKWIWYDSPAFNAFRGEAWMKQPCANCEYKSKDYGGCRCQAFRLTGDASNADPVCAKSPFHSLVVEAANQAQKPVIAPMIFRNRKNAQPF